MERHGKPVEEREVLSKQDALMQVLSDVNLGEDAYETAAVLTMTEKEAEAAYSFLRQKREDVSYIDRDSSEFHKGMTVTTYYLAKGLEFDQVFILGGDQGNSFYDQYKYIAATRALHELYVYNIEKK